MKINLKLSVFYTFVCLSFFTKSYGANLPQSYDIVIYGGTSAGVLAAVQAANMGKSVVLIEPGKHLGGMTSSGLSWVDVKTSKTIGGLAWKYFNQVWQYYLLDSSWIWETKYPIKGQLFHFHPDEHVMWTLEPSVGEKIFNAMIAEAKVPVIYNERLNRGSGVQLEGQRIVQIVMESGLTFNGKMFIDTTYEGDLMASSNVSYTVGREPNSQYQETSNGIHIDSSYTKKNPILIDAFLVKGNPQSGLLPRVYPYSGGNEGEGDSGVQAYNYRMCLTDIPENRVQIEKPEGYDESQYEILFRAIEASANPGPFFKLDLVPNRKTDSNNCGIVSTDYVGMSWNYPEADYETRKEIALKHEQWQRGLAWTLQNHPRVPAEIRAHYAPWGLSKDEFVDNNNWPYLLYMRETRRMVSPLVITEQMALGNVLVEDSIGLAYYAMDSHAIKYVVNSNGFLEIEGGGVHKGFKTLSHQLPGNCTFAT